MSWRQLSKLSIIVDQLLKVCLLCASNKINDHKESFTLRSNATSRKGSMDGRTSASSHELQHLSAWNY